MRFSPLDAQHRTLNAKMTPFGGWDMPLSYPSGTLNEHSACRNGAAIFDVSHLGTVRVEGADAFSSLQRNLTNDLSRIEPGRAQYTHLLDETNGSVLDDIIVWWLSDEVFDVMPNASNTERVVAAIGGVDTTSSRAIIAVQGPQSRDIVAKVSTAASQIGRFRVMTTDVGGVTCTVAGTGYTGEDGLEIAVPADEASVVWNSLIECGAIPAGLGARDTLRLEAALPLHGHELGEGITSLQAKLEWVIAWNKPEFRGRDILAQEKENGLKQILRGISIDGRRPARDGTQVLDSAGNNIGFVSSGNFSPTLEHCIALAFVRPDIEIGEHVQLDVRGTLLPGIITSTPFVAKKK